MPTPPPIFFYGTGSGTGKSTLTSRLANRMRWADLPCECIHETDILLLSGFKAFLAAFLRSDPAMAQDLKAAVLWLLESRSKPDTALIVDSVFPCVHWLLLGEAPESSIDEFVAWMGEELSSYDPLLVRLECPPDVRDRRAAAQRGSRWRERNASRRASYPLYRRLGEEAARPLVEATSFELAQRLPWRHAEFSTANQSPDQVVNGMAELVALPEAPNAQAWLPTDWLGRYESVESDGDYLEIRSDGDGLALKLRDVVVPLLPEPDGRWLAEGANGWLTPDLRNGSVLLEWIGSERRIYVRGQVQGRS